MPATVVCDPAIDAEAVRVYAVLSLPAMQGRTASMGLRQIAESIGRNVKLVRRRIEILEKTGHIRIHKRPNGQRSIYELTSPAQGSKQGKETIVAPAPSGGTRLVSIAEDVA